MTDRGGARRRRVRHLLAGLIALLWLAYAASVFLEPAVESGLRGFAGRKADTSSPPEVRVGAFPILPRLAAGRIPRISVDARDSLHAGWRVARLRVELRDVRLSWRAFLGGSREVVVGRGIWVADVDERAFEAYLARYDVQAEFRFRRGEVSMHRTVPRDGRVVEVSAGGRVSIEPRPLVRLVFAPDPPARDAELSVLLPPLPGGVAIDGVEVLDGALRFTAVEENWRHDAG